MADLVGEFKELRAKVEKKREAVNKAAARLEMLMSELSDKFGCSSVKKAKALLDSKQEELAEKRARLAELNASIEKSLEEFEDGIS